MISSVFIVHEHDDVKTYISTRSMATKLKKSTFDPKKHISLNSFIQNIKFEKQWETLSSDE